MELHLTATGCHLPYQITHCYLPPSGGMDDTICSYTEPPMPQS